MSLVDYERAFLEVRSRLLQKNSWGQRELLSLLTEVEVECRAPEGERDFSDGPVPLHARAPRSRDSRVGAA